MKKRIRKRFAAIFAACLTGVLFMVQSSAFEPVTIRLNGEASGMEGRLIGDTTYVQADEAGAKLARAAGVGPAVIDAPVGETYIEARGRVFAGNAVLEMDGGRWIPVRSLAKVYETAVEWNGADRSVDLYGAALCEDERWYDRVCGEGAVWWLSRIISAEAGAEPMTGKLLVGNVVLNRVQSGEFPDTIYGVIFDRTYGVQFTPTVNGTIFNDPDADSVRAAKMVLEGYSLSDSAVYFLNPALAKSAWVPQNHPYLFTVGGHDFYA